MYFLFIFFVKHKKKYLTKVWIIIFLLKKQEELDRKCKFLAAFFSLRCPNSIKASPSYWLNKGFFSIISIVFNCNIFVHTLGRYFIIFLVLAFNNIFYYFFPFILPTYHSYSDRGWYSYFLRLYLLVLSTLSYSATKMQYWKYL